MAITAQMRNLIPLRGQRTLRKSRCRNAQTSFQKCKLCAINGLHYLCAHGLIASRLHVQGRKPEPLGAARNALVVTTKIMKISATLVRLFSD